MEPFVQVGLRLQPRILEAASYLLSSVARGQRLEESTILAVDSHASTLPAVAVRDSPGKGSGLFAVDTIPEFTCILADDALLSLAQREDLPELWQKYTLLPADLRASFDNLSYPPHRVAQEPGVVAKLLERGIDGDTAERMARTSSIFQANAFKTGTSELLPDPRLLSNGSPRQKWSYALFPTVARINHSCTPNAHAHYHATSGQEVVVALREIQAGEEIEIAYFDLTMLRGDRGQRAKSWGFKCACPACAPHEKLQEKNYEQQLAVVHRACSLDASAIAAASPAWARSLPDTLEEALAVAHKAEFPWLRAALPKLYLNMSIVLRGLGNSAEEIDKALHSSREWERRISGLASTVSET